MYPASIRNRIRRAFIQSAKSSGQLAPIAIPSEIKAILSKPPCHHLRVKDLKGFIYFIIYDSRIIHNPHDPW